MLEALKDSRNLVDLGHINIPELGYEYDDDHDNDFDDEDEFNDEVDHITSSSHCTGWAPGS